MAGENDNPNNGDGTEEWGAGDEPLETEQLELAEDDTRLPWLESPEDEDYADEEASDSGRLIGLVLMGLVALAAIVGGIWWASHRSVDPALVADGSTVAAPDGPYKEAPKDPGGKTFAGTGDSSFAVSEGQNRPARLDGAGATPSAAAAPSSAGKPAVAAATGGVGVQVGAFSSKAAAEAGWSKLVAQSGVLSGVPHRVVAGSADIGTVHRLQAVAPDAAAASALCGRLKAAGISCQVK